MVGTDSADTAVVDEDLQSKQVSVWQIMNNPGKEENKARNSVETTHISNNGLT